MHACKQVAAVPIASAAILKDKTDFRDRTNVASFAAFLLAALCILPLAIGAQAVDQSPQRTYPVRRLQPKAFPELPKNLVTELERRGCTVPQGSAGRRVNVIQGEFSKPGQIDWAVLCSKQASTSLLVFWNSNAADPAVLAKFPDNPGRIFDWFIRPVDRTFIMDHYRAYGGPKPPPIDHQGIESGGDTASTVLYYYQRKWLALQGAD